MGVCNPIEEGVRLGMLPKSDIYPFVIHTTVVIDTPNVWVNARCWSFWGKNHTIGGLTAVATEGTL